MERGEDPIRKFLKDCKKLSLHVDLITEKANSLEIELDVLNRRSYRSQDPSPTALKVLEDTKQLGLQSEAKLSAIKEENLNFDTFLRGVLEQTKSLYQETTGLENYMAEYGYVVPPPLESSLFDVFSVTTPAAAGDLPQAEEDHQAAGSKQSKSEEPQRGAEQLSLFELGLSKETFRLITGLQNPRPDRKPRAGVEPQCAPGAEVKPACAPRVGVAPECAPAPVFDESFRVRRVEGGLGDTTADMDCTASVEPVWKYGIRTDGESVEISPGLFTKTAIRKEARKHNIVESGKGCEEEERKQCRTPDLKTQTHKGEGELPETPMLETINLRAFLSETTEKAEPLEKVLPDPLLEKVFSEPLQERVFPDPLQEKVFPDPLQEKVFPDPLQERVFPDSIQEKVFPDSIQERAPLNRVLAPSQQNDRTPELEMKSQDCTVMPETPVLDTFNIQTFLNKQDLRVKETPTSIHTPELECTISVTGKSEMPVTPKLLTIDIRKLLGERPDI